MDSSKRMQPIPLPTLKRLPIYYQYLTKQAREGVSDISCATIARDIGLVAVQVRKDLQLTGAVGRPKTGYQVEQLLKALSRTLGYDNKTEMFLIGAGSLGKALMGYQRFQDYNIGIAAAFDASDAVVGTEIAGKLVFPLSQIPLPLPPLAREIRRRLRAGGRGAKRGGPDGILRDRSHLEFRSRYPGGPGHGNRAQREPDSVPLGAAE